MDHFSHLSTRKTDQLKSKYKEITTIENVSALKSDDVVFLTGESDLGVALNGGRRGTRFGPEAIINSLGKFTFHGFPGDLYLSKIWNQISEDSFGPEKFDKAQESYSKRISSCIKGFDFLNPIIHIGGGHDHAYPFLMALSDKFDSIVILNIDAHCDTRQDQIPHSGTPFRNGASLSFDHYHIYQYGINDFSNSPSTLEKFKEENRHMEVFLKNNIDHLKTQKEISEHLNSKIEEKLLLEPELKQALENAVLFISLDSDALAHWEMPAVSAVNPNGITQELVKGIFKWARDQKSFKHTVYGIYEFNPLFDTLSGASAKTISHLIFETFISR